MSKNFNQIVIATDTFANWLQKTNDMLSAYANVVTTAANSSGDTTSGNCFVSGISGGNTVVVNYQLRGGTVDAAANLNIVSNVYVTGANTTFTSNVYVNAANSTFNSNVFAVTGTAGGNSVTISSNSTATNTTLRSHTLTLQGNTTVVNSASFSSTVAVSGALSLSSTQSFVNATGSPIVTVGANSVNVFTTTNSIIDSFSGSAYRGGKYVISVKDNDSAAYQMTEILVMHDGTTAYTTEYATLRSTGTNLATFSANLSGTTVRVWTTPNVSNSVYTLDKRLLSV